MLDMTFPEFEAAVKKTDVMLLPIGSIEEHRPSSPFFDRRDRVGQANVTRFSATCARAVLTRLSDHRSTSD